MSWKRKIYDRGKKHMRWECLERPGEWCQGIGAGRHTPCKSCPTRRPVRGRA